MPRSTRIVVALLAIAALPSAACAPRRELRIDPGLVAGAALTYSFDASVTTTLEQRTRATVRSTLAGTVELDVLDVLAEGWRLRVRFTPTSSSRDGEATEPGPAQEREVTLLGDGTVQAGGQDGDALVDAELEPELLATVLDPSVPSLLERAGTRWTDENGSGRLVALDRSGGRDLAELELRRERSVTRSRSLDGRPIDLEGSERTQTLLTWDLDAGIPTLASVASTAEFEVRAGALVGGTITIDATTIVRLLGQAS
jgi:hypothetical protein